MAKQHLDEILASVANDLASRSKVYIPKTEKALARINSLTARQRAAFDHWYKTWPSRQHRRSKWPIGFWKMVADALLDGRLPLGNNFLIPLGDYEPGIINSNEAMELLVSRNNRGIQKERSGDLLRAAYIYETSIADRFFGTHPYDRLRIIYRRNGWYQDAIRVCTAYLDLPDRPHGQDKPHFRHHLTKLENKVK